MQPARGELVIDSSDDGHVLARFNPLILAVFTRAPREEELALMDRLAREGLDDGIQGGLLYVVARKDMSGGIDPRVRALFEKMIRKYEGRSGSSAVVVLTTGFAAAAIRGALAGLLAIFERRRILRAFGSIDEACAWLSTEHAIPQRALVDAYRRATAHLEMPGAGSERSE